MTIWGWGQAGTNPASQWVSYAFPAGASMVPINSVVVPNGESGAGGYSTRSILLTSAYSEYRLGVAKP